MFKVFTVEEMLIEPFAPMYEKFLASIRKLSVTYSLCHLFRCT